MQVLGRAYPVQLMYAPEPQPDYVEAAVTTVLQLHVDAAPGDVLVFLTGQEGPTYYGPTYYGPTCYGCTCYGCTCCGYTDSVAILTLWLY